MSNNYFENNYVSIVQELYKKPTLYILLSSILLCIVVWLAQWKKSRQHMYKIAKKTPYPHNVSIYPIIGHAHLFSGGMQKIFKSLGRIFKNQDGPRVVWLAHRLFYTVSDPADLEIILNSRKSQEKDELYRFSKPLGGEGIFAAPVVKWKKNRKFISPALTKKNIDGFVHIFSDQADIFCEILKKHDGGDFFNCAEMVGNWTLDSICETAMSLKANCQTTDSILSRSIHRCCEIIMLRMFNVAYHSDFIFNLTKVSREENKLTAYIRSFTEKIIQQKKEEYKNRLMESHTVVEAQIDEMPKKKAFVDMLLEMSKDGVNFTDQDLRDEVQTFIAAGSDTSATTLSFIMVMLGMFPQYQQKVYEEVIEVLGPDRPVEHTDISKFVYLDKFIKETMRLFPIGPNIVRQVTDDLELTTCTVPKRAGIVLGIITNHRSSKYFPDPLKFDPERFNPEEVTKRHPYSYLPFSGGPRNCIGIIYAMMSMKTFVATVIRRYSIETTYRNINDVKIKQAVIIHAVNGYPIKVTSRD